ncbi:hypothetical protein VDGL01_07467 [Verticillium dahliae]
MLRRPPRQTNHGTQAHSPGPRHLLRARSVECHEDSVRALLVDDDTVILLCRRSGRCTKIGSDGNLSPYTVLRLPPPLLAVHGDRRYNSHTPKLINVGRIHAGEFVARQGAILIWPFWVDDVAQVLFTVANEVVLIDTWVCMNDNDYFA